VYNKVLTVSVLFILLVFGGLLLLNQTAKSPTQKDSVSVVDQGKNDLIRNINIKPGNIIKSPLTITGEARGYWYFEASFPVVLVDWDGKIIAEGIATAQDEWMTEDFVPFEATLEFTKPSYGENGALILQKDNPSDLPELDDALEIPIKFY